MVSEVIILIVVGVLFSLIATSLRRRASRARLDEWIGTDDTSFAADPATRRGLARWLGLAGYWTTSAATTFLAAQGAAVIVGLAAAGWLANTAVSATLADSVSSVPGGVGELMASILSMAPWIAGTILALGPVLRVRAQRRRLVREVDADLPLVLEIFATLAEAGLGFDASLMRLLDATPGDRPLHAAFRAFQRDVRAGVPRVQAFRQLGARLEVPSVSVFVSAVVQAEHVGAGIAGTFRRQADDVRDRRRERVNLLGQMLPVKLMFPLVACFLPGIFLTTLGPALLQMIEVAGGFLR